ncbi:transposase [Enterococcus faecium]|uniref:Transposase n=1 Tax=Enterococcus faecium TaxID=1352 RepID=A0A242AT26_ENTFC|nr:transposase [Enterococcus faecium]
MNQPAFLAPLPLEVFIDLLQEKGRGRFKNPEKIAQAIQRAIRSSYRLGSVTQESINAVLGVIVC